MQDRRTSRVLAGSNGRDWTFAGFFFHDRGSNEQKSLAAMLQEVLYQILLQIGALISVVLPHYKKLSRDQRTRSPIWDVESLKEGLSGIMKQRKTTACICFFLDALDEHDGDNDQLAMLIHELASVVDNKRIKLKICLASRSWNIFRSQFGTCPGFAIQDYTQSDIRIYTTSRLYDAYVGIGRPSHVDTISNGLKSLIEQVTQKARGVFIWVKLVVDELAEGVRDGTPPSVWEDRVSEMPQELEDLYLHTLRKVKVEYTAETYIILQIVLCSLSPLPLATLINCTSYARWGEVHDDDASQEDMLRNLSSRSGGLLEAVSIEPGDATDDTRFETEPTPATANSLSAAPKLIVQFIHQTVKEFAHRYRHDLSLQTDMISRKSGDYYLVLSAAPVSHRWADEIRRNIFTYAKNADLNAADNLLLMTSDHSAIPLDNILSGPTLYEGDGVDWLFQYQLEEFEFYRLLFERYRVGKEYQLLCLAVAADLLDYVRNKCATRPTLWKGLTEKPTLLQIAAVGPWIVPGRGDRTAMIRLLLELGAEVDQNVTLPMFQLAKSPKDFYSSHFTALALLIACKKVCTLAEEDRLAVAKVLLEHGSDPQAVLYESAPWAGLIGITLLHQCAKFESEAMVRLFLRYGADATAQATVLSEDKKRAISPGMTAVFRRDPGILRAFRDSEWTMSSETSENVVAAGLAVAVSSLLLAAVDAPLGFEDGIPDHLTEHI